MAEAVGLVASVIGIAGLAGKIVKTTCRVKSLLEEVSNAPEDLQRHLDQINLFVPILAAEINDDGPPDLRVALCAAVSQCQQAANDLGKLAEDLSSQIRGGSSGKLRRKVQATRVVLQKDIFAAHEKRLSSAMQMLIMASQMYGLAQQRYLLDLQRSQPNVIVTQVLAGLAIQGAHPPSSEPKQQSGKERGNILSNRRRDRAQTGVWNRQFFPGIRLGSADFTGSLEIEYGGKYQDDENEPVISVTRLRVRLPRWLSTRALDSILQRSQEGWNCFLHTSRCHPGGSETSGLVFEALNGSGDSLQNLQPLLADGRLSFRDTFQSRIGGEYSLMSIAVFRRDWPLCAFLTAYDLDYSTKLIPMPSWTEYHGNLSDIRKVFIQYHDKPSEFIQLFYFCIGPVEWFHTLRSSVWPDMEFYDESSTLTRIKLAIELLPDRLQGHWSISPSKIEPLIRYVLCRDGRPSLTGIRKLSSLYTDYSFWLMRLFISLGTISFHEGESDNDAWLTFFSKLLVYVVNETLQIHPDLSFIPEFLYDYISLTRFRGDLIEDLKVSQAAVWILKKQLFILSGLGISLYALGECFKFQKENSEPHFPLIISSYGNNPEDWELWEREMTDKFAGESWEWADPQPLWIPGAWVDEG